MAFRVRGERSEQPAEVLVIGPGDELDVGQQSGVDPGGDDRAVGRFEPDPRVLRMHRRSAMHDDEVCSNVDLADQHRGGESLSGQQPVHRILEPYS